MYFVVEDKVTKRVRVCDLINLPVRPKSDKRKRKAPRKIPNWHLTSEESLAYIEESNKKTEEKEKQNEEENTVKHKAVLEHRRLKKAGNKTIKKSVSVLPKN